MNVLYIDGCGRFGEPPEALRVYKTINYRKKVNPIFICQKGTAADYYSQFSQNVFKVPF